jgi:uncharacterized membrane protein YcaP (DUF421 family)
VDDVRAGLLSLLGDPETLVLTVLRVVTVYGTILVGLRLSGKRLLGQLSPFDLVTLLLLANVVQNAMMGPDTSLLGGLIGAAVLLVLNRLVATSGWAREHVEGHPVVLVLRGAPQRDNLLRERVSLDELETAIREHGVAKVEDVESAILEMDGTISVIAREHVQVRHLKKVRSTRNR